MLCKDTIDRVGVIGIMEKNMEIIGIIAIVQGLYREYRVYMVRCYRDNTKDNGNNWSMIRYHIGVL